VLTFATTLYFLLTVRFASLGSDDMTLRGAGGGGSARYERAGEAGGLQMLDINLFENCGHSVLDRFSYNSCDPTREEAGADLI
jgi:hypothetical protein